MPSPTPPTCHASRSEAKALGVFPMLCKSGSEVAATESGAGMEPHARPRQERRLPRGEEALGQQWGWADLCGLAPSGGCTETGQPVAGRAPSGRKQLHHHDGAQQRKTGFPGRGPRRRLSQGTWQSVLALGTSQPCRRQGALTPGSRREGACLCVAICWMPLPAPPRTLQLRSAPFPVCTIHRATRLRAGQPASIRAGYCGAGL